MRFNVTALKCAVNLCLFILMVFLALNHQTVIYLTHQAKGQLSLLWKKQSFEKYRADNKLSAQAQSNLLLVNKIKKFSEDSLGFKPTGNFTKVYDQGKQPTLWVITACEPYALQAYEWHFPIVGRVSYKGFFEKELAKKEAKKMATLGYDTDIRGVSAWSTLGWFEDPVLSNTLERSTGAFCDLLFHELFHATYYAKSSVDFNENLASFVANKATLRFLAGDSSARMNYLETLNDEKLFSRFMLRKAAELKEYYSGIKNLPLRLYYKNKKLKEISDSIALLPLKKKERFLLRKRNLLQSRNACFIDVEQYDSMQDSIEAVFNKIYRRDIKKLVQDLTLNKINY